MIKDFTSAVTYTVTADDGTTQAYTVAVSNSADTVVPGVVLSDDHPDAMVRDADTVIITADFIENDLIDLINQPEISIGSIVSATNMTKVGRNNKKWQFTWNVPAGNDGNAAVTIAAKDAAGNANSASTSADDNVTRDTTAPTAPTAVALTPVGGTVVANALNTTNTNLTAQATITAGQATGGEAELLVGGVSFATAIKDTGIVAGDTTVTFTANTANNVDLQTAITAGGVISVRVKDVAGNTSVSSVSNPTLLVDYGYISTNIGNLKYVPAGTFQRDATPTNTSTVSTFRMSQHEITRTQFNTIMLTDPSNVTYSSGVTDPVQMTNWYHAIAFCNKLSSAEGLTPAYAVTGVDFSTLTYAAIPTVTDATWNAATCNWAANGYRLPTEMEWMWAAMGADTGNPGTTNTTGYLKTFAGSTGVNLIGDYAWYDVNSSFKTHPAGVGKTANELGLFDMSGNVAEWCWDRYAGYPAGPQSNYHNDAGSTRVFRGGSWGDWALEAVVAARVDTNPHEQGSYIGFRVVRP